MFRYISIIICLALLGFFSLNATADAQKIMTVQVREGQIRATPSHLGKIVAKTSYGDRVTVLEERGAWKKVSISAGNLHGWMHETALTSKKIALKAGEGNAGTFVTINEIALAGKSEKLEVIKSTTSPEINLAGKGVSEEMEAQYRIVKMQGINEVPGGQYERIIRLNNPEKIQDNTLEGLVFINKGAKICTDYPLEETIKSLDELTMTEKHFYQYFSNYAIKVGDKIFGFVSIPAGYSAILLENKKDEDCKYKVQIISPTQSRR